MTSTVFKQEVLDVLKDNILSFWLDKMQDRDNGGFYGRIDGHDVLDEKAEKGAILNARILWSFSAAYRVLGNPEYLEAARRAKRYIIDHFLDKEYGGVFWSVDYKGNPLDTKKQSYAIGFTIYGMSELARATGDKEALDVAISLFHDLEQHAFDPRNNGYLEAMTREWGRIDDMRLSDKDENGSKTMNTHLHILEPYTNLLRVWRDPLLVRQHGNLLVNIFCHKLLNPVNHHLDLFFDDNWNGTRNIYSYGHDIEASWLMHEAAIVLNDSEIIKTVEPIVKLIATAADEGLRENGAMIHETVFEPGTSRVRHADNDFHWWVQCESVIGHVNLYEHFGDKTAYETAVRNWVFIRDRLLDRRNGEWHWSVREDNTLNHDDDKAGFWKCPYHNTRMCLELVERGFHFMQ